MSLRSIDCVVSGGTYKNMSAKKGVCELCGFADDGYSIEENGTVTKVCKFCHDGYLERMGLPPDEGARVENLELTLDINSATEDISDAAELTQSAFGDVRKTEKKPAEETDGEDEKDYEEEQSGMKVEPLSEEELNKVLWGGHKKSRIKPAVGKEENSASSDFARAVKESNSPAAAEKAEPEKAEKAEKSESSAQKKPRHDIMDEVNPKIDDERIKITSPEVRLARDERPKTNLDVEVTEYKSSVRFLNAFKYVFHEVVYAILLGLVVATVTTVLFVVKTWQEAVTVLAGGVIAIGLSYFLMWFLRSRYEKDKRAYLLRIRQQEILFESMNSDCYRELKTKFTVMKSLGWLLGKLSVLLPLAVIIGGVVASVITCFLVKFWLMPIVLFGTIVGAIIMYWIVKFFADVVGYALDLERNQQIQSQTLLDILKVLKK